MAAQNAFDAHHAWKLVFVPYVSRSNGTLVPGCVTLAESASSSACGNISALPVVISAFDTRRHLQTRATAVLIRSDRGSATPARIEANPLSSAAPSAAIRFIAPLKGRFSA